MASDTPTLPTWLGVHILKHRLAGICCTVSVFSFSQNASRFFIGPHLINKTRVGANLIASSFITSGGGAHSLRWTVRFYKWDLSIISLLFCLNHNFFLQMAFIMFFFRYSVLEKEKKTCAFINYYVRCIFGSTRIFLLLIGIFFFRSL